AAPRRRLRVPGWAGRAVPRLRAARLDGCDRAASGVPGAVLERDVRRARAAAGELRDAAAVLPGVRWLGPAADRARARAGSVAVHRGHRGADARRRPEQPVERDAQGHGRRPGDDRRGWRHSLMLDAAEVKRRIEAGLPGAEVEVRDMTGTGDHFEA